MHHHGAFCSQRYNPPSNVERLPTILSPTLNRAKRGSPADIMNGCAVEKKLLVTAHNFPENDDDKSTTSESARHHPASPARPTRFGSRGSEKEHPGSWKRGSGRCHRTFYRCGGVPVDRVGNAGVNSYQVGNRTDVECTRPPIDPDELLGLSFCTDLCRLSAGRATDPCTRRSAKPRYHPALPRSGRERPDGTLALRLRRCTSKCRSQGVSRRRPANSLQTVIL